MCVQFTLVEEFSGKSVELTVFSDDENSVMGQVNGPFRIEWRYPCRRNILAAADFRGCR